VVSWRWTFWIGLIVGLATLPLVVFMPESFAPVLLKRRAQKLRKETGNTSIVAALELQKGGAKEMITKTCTRPIRMLIHESIVLFTSLYLSLAYAIFYLYFQAYPIIFQGKSFPLLIIDYILVLTSKSP
jgi:MFS family permease